MRKIAVILGARPNFVKAAPFFRRALSYPNIDLTLIHTGQHFDDNMSKIFFEEMSIPRPHIHLATKGELHTEKIGKMFNSLQNIFKEQKFDGVVVFGDVSSTLAGGLAAAKHGHRLIHVEAGLRSHDRRMPEEINRVIVDHLSDLLFTSELSGSENLLKEGIPESKIHHVGNIMIENLEIFADRISQSAILNKLGLKSKQYFVATIHRQENTDNEIALRAILALLEEINEEVQIVFPIHPGTKKQIEGYGLSKLLEKFILIEPLGYFDFTKLVAESIGVITDSGGIQEETSHLGVPCATLRDNTERPITVEYGSNKLFPEKQRNAKEIMQHLRRSNFKKKPIPLWDAEVSKRIFDLLL